MRSELHLAHELLDLELHDREDEHAGRVDEVLLAFPAEGPPRVAAIETGGDALWRRVHPALARLAAALRRRLGMEETSGRIEWSRVTKIGYTIQADVDDGETPSARTEEWARERIVGRIPGA